MAIFNLSSEFTAYTNGQSSVDVGECATVSDCIELFLQQYPSCPPSLFYNGCSISVNGSDVFAQNAQGYSTGCGGASTSIGCGAGGRSFSQDGSATGQDVRYQNSGCSGSKNDLEREIRWRIFDTVDEMIDWQRSNNFDPNITDVKIIQPYAAITCCPDGTVHEIKQEEPRFVVFFWLPIISNTDKWSEVSNLSTGRRQE